MDGSFGAPHVLGAEADGCLGPHGYSFAAAPSGNTAPLVFAHDDPFDSPDTKADLYFLAATLDQDDLWAHYAVTGGVPTVTGMRAVRVAPILPARQGNPSFAANVLVWDDEDLPSASRDLFFATESGTLPNVTADDAGVDGGEGASTLGVSLGGVEEIQPAFDGDDLYRFGEGGISRATKIGADLSKASSWSPRARILGPASGGAGTVFAVGEPTVAHLPSGETELYFVYLKRTTTGLDGAVGRVLLR